MLRPATSDSLARLRLASSGSDRQLDRALCDVGILPPVDLDHIRSVLARPGTELSTSRNRDGHVVVEVFWDATLSVMIHHDGRVQILSTAAA